MEDILNELFQHVKQEQLFKKKKKWEQIFEHWLIKYISLSRRLDQHRNTLLPLKHHFKIYSESKKVHVYKTSVFNAKTPQKKQKKHHTCVFACFYQFTKNAHIAAAFVLFFKHKSCLSFSHKFSFTTTERKLSSLPYLILSNLSVTCKVLHLKQGSLQSFKLLKLVRWAILSKLQKNANVNIFQSK